MRLLDRYLLRQLVTPLGYAFAAMTSIMLLNQVARRFGDLVGKGLPWSVIGEVFTLCLPFIVAMTLPMAVLLAVLYSFSHLAADNEITAMRASGVSVGQLLAPMFLAGVVLSGINFAFTDQVLPRTNARLRNLLINIQRKKPTFELREQVINEIPPSGLFLRASRVEATSGRLRNVTIYDLAAEKGRRIIYADSGRMAFVPGQTDLSLHLFDGSIHEFKADQPELLQLTYFTSNQIRVKDVSNQLELTMSDNVRGDREMSTCEMLEIVQAAGLEADLADRQRTALVRRDLHLLLGLPSPAPLPNALPPIRVTGYCRQFQRLHDLLFPKTANAQAPAQAPAPGRKPVPLKPPLAGVQEKGLSGPALSQRVGADGYRSIRLTSWGEVSSARENIRSAGLRADQFAVEVHKKWAISVACLVFVLVGIPMALRFPRGGMGLVIGGGLAVFSIYYVGLIAGEGLGNKGILSPVTAMWGPDVLFTVLGLFGLWRVSRESGSTRGGDLADLLETFIGRFRRGAR
ncbi:MAG: LptF/LptG family permease [Gemmatimonadales bacterium]